MKIEKLPLIIIPDWAEDVDPEVKRWNALAEKINEVIEAVNKK